MWLLLSKGNRKEVKKERREWWPYWKKACSWWSNGFATPCSLIVNEMKKRELLHALIDVVVIKLVS